jgi:alkyl hydroperoxide reductase subunit AhpC
MALQIGDIAPNFTADTTEGAISLHDYIADGWLVFFSHPKDFTPVCTTELSSAARLKPEFDKRNVKLLEVSVDSVDDHKRWKEDIRDLAGVDVGFPMIGDETLEVVKLYGMIHPNAKVTKLSSAEDNATVRNVYIIGPDKRIKLIISYPMSVGRNFTEILRVIDSLQLSARHSVATPADWRPGEDVVIQASLSDTEAKTTFPDGWKTLNSYLRMVRQPKLYS